MIVLLEICKFVLNIIYCFFKLFRTNNDKILFISRQSNEITLDFDLLYQALKKKKKNYKIVIICKKFDNIQKKFIVYIYWTLKMMYHLATSKVCVIDSYCLPVSVLKHKKSLKILQIWHSLGAIKQFGYQTLGKKSGRNHKLALGLNMHKNYDLIVSGSNEMTKYFEKAFNYESDKFINVGLPRIDYLLHQNIKIKNKIIKAYPELNKKKVILYVPTFRKNKDCTIYVNELINVINYKKYNLIIKSHPNQDLILDENIIYTCKEFSAIDLLTIADYVITDYSGIAIEAAVLDKKTYYYLYDYDEYKKNNGLNIDIYNEMPQCAFKHASDLFNKIDNGVYNYEALQKYKSKYITNLKGNSTELIVEVINNWCEVKMTDVLENKNN